jgi:hypothetical protein
MVGSPFFWSRHNQRFEMHNVAPLPNLRYCGLHSAGWVCTFVAARIRRTAHAQNTRSGGWARNREELNRPESVF